jgi:tagatose 1,6-diphosphate aldolase GatY/KbaY
LFMYKNILREAKRQGFAIPAFNYSDIFEFIAIVESAKELNAPVYAASAMVTVNSVGLEYCAAFGKVAYEKYEGKVYNHLDHCTDVEICKRAVDNGYHSVMLDASRLPLETNIAMTQEIVSYAHRYGVLVEAELGQIAGRSDETEEVCQVEIERPTPESCVRLAKETGVDSLAIGIGNQHGYYDKYPKLNIDLLREVCGMVDIPLVLHGSTGLHADDVRRCIAAGVSKVNIGTAIHHAYKASLAATVASDFDSKTVADIALAAKDAMKCVIKEWIKICGADGKVQAV